MFEKELIENIKELNDKGYSIERIALELNVGKEKVSKLIKENNIKKTTIKNTKKNNYEERVLQLNKVGLSQTIIAYRLGISIGVVRSILEKNNLLKKRGAKC